MTGIRLSAAVLAAAIGATSPAFAATNPYMGDAVQQATAPNGALMNASLAKGRGAVQAPRVVSVRPGLWVLRNFSIVNCVVIETPQGLVVMDTGTSLGQGEMFLAEIRKLSKKPILAIIYSHFHYTQGAGALVAGAGSKSVMVIGHPKLEANLQNRSLQLDPANSRRANMQFGAYLPETGPDAGIRPPAPKVTDPAKLASGHVKVNHPVANGETLSIGGMAFQFFHAQGDTDDTLSVYVPQLSAVVTNVTASQYFALYTLRGETYREPQAVIDSYDTIRRLRPEYYVPVHGDPVTGADLIYDRMTAHRDAYSFTFNQAIRGINKGWGPDELAANIHLPEHLTREPTLYQGYSEFDFALRGIYRGIVGWYAEEGADLHPPQPAVLGRAVVEGFGGMDALAKQAKSAQDRREYALAAKLASFGVAADPTNVAIRQTEADALRSMAQVSTGSQGYNFLLTEARHLEGKQDKYKAVAGEFGATSFDAIKAGPPRALVFVLESRIDADMARAVTGRLRVQFTDVPDAFDVAVRQGVAEVTASSGAAGPVLNIDRRTWFDLTRKTVTLAQAVASAKAKVAGGAVDDVSSFLALFDPV